MERAIAHILTFNNSELQALSLLSKDYYTYNNACEMMNILTKVGAGYVCGIHINSWIPPACITNDMSVVGVITYKQGDEVIIIGSVVQLVNFICEYVEDECVELKSVEILPSTSLSQHSSMAISDTTICRRMKVITPYRAILLDVVPVLEL